MVIRSIWLALLVSASCGWIPAIAVEMPKAKPAAVDPVHKAVEDAHKFYAAAKYNEAAKVYLDTIKLTDKAVGPMAQLNRAILYSNLGTVYFAQKKFPEAEQAYKTSIDIHKALLKGHAAVVADTLQHYSALLQRTNRAQEADRWRNQADFLLEANISGNSTIVDPPAWTEPANTGSFTSGAAAKPDAPTSSIVRLVQMNASDRALLDNPTTVEKPVYRSEEYYEGGGGYAFGGLIVGQKKTRQVLDHYETVPLADSKAGLSYPTQIADLERTYRLSNSGVRSLIDAVNSGGTAIELGNDWLVVADETLDPSVWYGGLKVEIQKTPEGNYTIATADGKAHQTVKRLAIRQ
jgi:tetratricopeptide (TPR) repeat protein